MIINVRKSKKVIGWEEVATSISIYKAVTRPIMVSCSNWCDFFERCDAVHGYRRARGKATSCNYAMISQSSSTLLLISHPEKPKLRKRSIISTQNRREGHMRMFGPENVETVCRQCQRGRQYHTTVDVTTDSSLVVFLWILFERLLISRGNYCT